MLVAIMDGPVHMVDLKEDIFGSFSANGSDGFKAPLSDERTSAKAYECLNGWWSLNVSRK